MRSEALLAFLLLAPRGLAGEGAAPAPLPLQRWVATVRGEGAAVETLHRFYTERGHTPAWFLPEGAPRPEVQDALAALCGAQSEGLAPERYQAEALANAVAQVRAGKGDWREVEVALTRSVLQYALDMVGGQLPPGRFGWPTRPREVDLPPVLSHALLTGDIAGALGALAPPHAGSHRLRAALWRYQAIQDAGGWPQVPQGPTLERGARNARVRVLRERLEVTGEFGEEAETEDPALFDPALEEAVRRFQHRHGLAEDGRVGARTLRALRVPVEERLHQLRINLERWRWLPADLGERHVRVNLATFTLEAVEDETVEHRMRVITGAPGWPTPLLEDRITHLVVHPRWGVPKRIAREEVLPMLREDPGAAQRLGLRIYAKDGTEIDAFAVDWTAVEPHSLPFFRQDAARGNPLGNLKFLTTNRSRIILHDTPKTHLFAEPRRAFSHGCVRVEEPEALARFLLREAEAGQEALTAALASDATRHLPLPAPVPVYLLYWTAEVGPDGVVRFAPDVYGEDAALLRAVPQPAKGLETAACTAAPRE